MIRQALVTAVISLSNLAILGTANDAWAKPELGSVPPTVVLDGDSGGRVKGGAWSSDELKGKVHVLFYVDPDEKDTNDRASQVLKREAFPSDQFGAYAVINMAATWIPNNLINKNLEAKQKEFPNTIYVKDLKKGLVKSWGIGDEASVVMLFDKDGKLLFHKDGKLDGIEVNQLVSLVKERMVKEGAITKTADQGKAKSNKKKKKKEKK